MVCSLLKRMIFIVHGQPVPGNVIKNYVYTVHQLDKQWFVLQGNCHDRLCIDQLEKKKTIQPSKNIIFLCNFFLH